MPSSTDGEDAAAVLTAHAEPPPVSVFVVMREALEEDTEEGSENDMAVDEHTPPTMAQEEAAPPPPPQPVQLKDTTFRFQLYGPFFKIISYTYRADPALGLLRILPGTTRPLLVGIQADDRRATPALHDLWAYADLMAPPAPEPRWPEDEERRAAGEAERGWVDAALKSRESPAAVAQLALPPRPIREKFTRGLVAIEWDDWSMSLCGACMDEPNMIYLFQFAPTPTESEYFHPFVVLSLLADRSPPNFSLSLCCMMFTEQDGHRFPIPVPDVDERFREISEKDPFGMTGIIPGNASR